MLATEADVVRTLRAGTYTLIDLYELCAQRAPVERAGGHDPVPGHAGDRRWKRRVRGALQALRARGRAHRIARSTWAIDGPAERPTRLVLIVAGATPADLELRLQSAVELLAELEEPVDLVVADPPFGLGRGCGRFARGRGYRRDHRRVLGGYVDVDPTGYEQFTREWVSAAAGALRPGGQLAVITGPQRAAHAQIAAEHAGLAGDDDRGAARVRAAHAAAPGVRALDDHRPGPWRTAPSAARVPPARRPARCAVRARLPAGLMGSTTAAPTDRGRCVTTTAAARLLAAGCARAGVRRS